MKIISLTAENVKRLVSIEIKPDGNLVEITGRNKQGKTSVLDCIMWAIEGAKHIQAQPIRKGEKTAKIRLNLGEMTIQRTFARDEVDGSTTSKLVVMASDGATYGSPQGMLDALLSELCFDPLAFAKADAKDQFNMLRKLVPGVDFAQIAMDNKDDEEERKGINRLLKQARESAKTAGAGLPDDLPDAPPDESELVRRLQEAGEANTLLARQQADLQAWRASARDKRVLADDQLRRVRLMRDEADALEALASATREAAAGLEAKAQEVGRLPEPVDTQSLTKALADARALAIVLRRRDESRRLTTEADKLEARSKAITARMRKREEDKQASIAKAELPVEGLGFGEEGILLNGLPFDQASDAEQLTASLLIAMAQSPKLRVARIRDGSLLDTQAMKLLAELADKHNMQIWVERVDSSGQVGFVIEDGHVAKIGVSTVEKAQQDYNDIMNDPAHAREQAARGQ